MSDIITVKKAIIDMLRADQDLQSLLTKDRYGNYPVYHSLIQHWIHKPSVTVEDVTEQGEVSGLNDSYDGSKRYGWQFAVIQVDCWSGRNSEERDQLQAVVQKAMLKGSSQAALKSNGVLYVQEPTVLALDESDSKPPLWRKSLRYRVFYVLEVE